MSTPTVGSQSPVRWLPIALVVVSTLGTPASVAHSQVPITAPSRISFSPDVTPTTAVSEEMPSVVVANRPEDVVVDQVMEFLDFHDGWDGEDAPAPPATSVLDAVVFLQAAGDQAINLEPTLHADGSVMLEIDGGADGVLKFRGDGTVSYAIAGHAPGEMPFSKALPPSEVIRLLRA